MKKPRLKILTIGVIEGKKNEYLIVLSQAEPVATRTWSFVSGFANAGESPEASMRRVTVEKLGIVIDIEVGQPPLVETMDGESIEVRCFFCTIKSGRADARAYEEIRWIAKGHLREYSFDPLSQKIAEWVLAE